MTWQRMKEMFDYQINVCDSTLYALSGIAFNRKETEKKRDR